MSPRDRAAARRDPRRQALRPRQARAGRQACRAAQRSGARTTALRAARVDRVPADRAVGAAPAVERDRSVHRARSVHPQRARRVARAEVQRARDADACEIAVAAQVQLRASLEPVGAAAQAAALQPREACVEVLEHRHARVDRRHQRGRDDAPARAVCARRDAERPQRARRDREGVDGIRLALAGIADMLAVDEALQRTGDAAGDVAVELVMARSRDGHDPRVRQLARQLAPVLQRRAHVEAAVEQQRGHVGQRRGRGR
jgi:hypothetical protein